MRDTGGISRRRIEGAVLHETAAVLLAEEGQSVPDWEIVGPQITAEIERQSGQLLADAGMDYDAFERLRARAAHAYGRADPAVCVLAGTMSGYLFLVIAGPEFLSLAGHPGLGLTPWILAILVVALGIRWTLWRRQRTALMRSVPEAFQRWIGVLRDQVLRPFIVEKRNDEVRNPRLFDTSIGEKSPPRLIEGSEPRRLVMTEAMAQVSVDGAERPLRQPGGQRPARRGQEHHLAVLRHGRGQAMTAGTCDWSWLPRSTTSRGNSSFTCSASCARQCRTARPTGRRSRRRPAVTWSSSGTCARTRRAGRRH